PGPRQVLLPCISLISIPDIFSWPGEGKMGVPSHLESMVACILASPVESPEPPWRLIGGFGIGGVTAVGVGPRSDLLLVVSWSGRGVFDCVTGERVARDPAAPQDGTENWQDDFELEAQGIGPLEGQRIRTAGLFGGGLPRLTHDGWIVEQLA